MELGDIDASGRRRPVPIPGSEFNVEVDTLILAISQEPDVSPLTNGNGLNISKWSTFEVDPETLLTNVEGIFAGGDAVAGPNTVTEAMAHGKIAAQMIDKYIRGEKLERKYEVTRPALHVEPIKLSEEEVKSLKKPGMPSKPVAQRIENFEEVELGFTEADAINEAKRCLRCDLEEEEEVAAEEEAVAEEKEEEKPEEKAEVPVAVEAAPEEKEVAEEKPEEKAEEPAVAAVAEEKIEEKAEEPAVEEAAPEQKEEPEEKKVKAAIEIPDMKEAKAAVEIPEMKKEEEVKAAEVKAEEKKEEKEEPEEKKVKAVIEIPEMKKEEELKATEEKVEEKAEAAKPEEEIEQKKEEEKEEEVAEQKEKPEKKKIKAVIEIPDMKKEE